MVTLRGPGRAGPWSLAAAVDDPIRDALRSGKFPWYDVAKDAAKPITPPADPTLPSWLKGWNLRAPFDLDLGVLVVILLGTVGLALLVAILVNYWRRGRVEGEAASAKAAVGGAARLEALPPELRTDAADPWAEAMRLRDLGDLAGATVRLFAHQLVTLDRIGQVRLAPGKTGRQLARQVADAALRDHVGATLRLFESVAYGHRTPSPEAFDAIWRHAEAFQRRVAAGVAA